MNANNPNEISSSQITEQKGVVYAGFAIRLLAYIFDVIILSAILWMIGFYLGVIVSFFGMNPNNISNILYSSSPYILFELFLGYFFYVFYSIFFLSFFSSTPGKNLCKLKVISENNNRISFVSSVLRSLLQPFSIFFFGIGYVYMLKSDKKQAWHDKIAKTVVIKQPAPKNILKTILTYILIYIGLFALLMAIILIKNNLFKH